MACAFITLALTLLGLGALAVLAGRHLAAHIQRHRKR